MSKWTPYFLNSISWKVVNLKLPEKNLSVQKLLKRKLTYLPELWEIPSPPLARYVSKFNVVQRHVSHMKFKTSIPLVKCEEQPISLIMYKYYLLFIPNYLLSEWINFFTRTMYLYTYAENLFQIALKICSRPNIKRFLSIIINKYLYLEQIQL